MELELQYMKNHTFHINNFNIYVYSLARTTFVSFNYFVPNETINFYELPYCLSLAINEFLGSTLKLHLRIDNLFFYPQWTFIELYTNMEVNKIFYRELVFFLQPSNISEVSS